MRIEQVISNPVIARVSLGLWGRLRKRFLGGTANGNEQPLAPKTPEEIRPGQCVLCISNSERAGQNIIKTPETQAAQGKLYLEHQSPGQTLHRKPPESEGKHENEDTITPTLEELIEAIREAEEQCLEKSNRISGKTVLKGTCRKT